MLRLYTSWFSTFGRKVATGLELKGLPYEAVDGLRRDFRPELLKLNPRAEVPVLVDGATTVVDSADILQYLDVKYPARPLYPPALEERVAARALERLADRRLDPLVVCTSFWHWAERDDAPPDGLLDAAQRDLDRVLPRLERELENRPRPWPFGRPGVVECAWFPNLAALKSFGFHVPESRYPSTFAWMQALRNEPVFIADRQRTSEFLRELSSSHHERRRLFWSGDRLEWMLSQGFHEWLVNEIRCDRVAFAPG